MKNSSGVHAETIHLDSINLYYKIILGRFKR